MTILAYVVGGLGVIALLYVVVTFVGERLYERGEPHDEPDEGAKATSGSWGWPL